MTAPSPPRTVVRLFFAIAAVASMAACGDDGPSGPDEPSGPDDPSETVEIGAPVTTDLLVGDSLILGAASSAGAVSWSSRSAQVVAVDPSGVVHALRPGRAWVVARAGDARDSVQLQVAPRPGGYSAAEVDYFMDIALGYEFGGASQIVRRWATDVRYEVKGSPTAEDLNTLADVVSDINDLTTLHDLVEDPVSPSVEIHFIPEDRFTEVLSNVVPGNVGYFSVWWNGSQQLIRSVVLLATDISQDLRTHLIREEVTQMLGLGRDSSLYPESIFYERFSLTDAYAPIDEALIEMLYRPEVRVGMDEAAVGRVLRRLTRPGVTAAPTAAAAEVPFPAPPLRAGRGSGN